MNPRAPLPPLLAALHSELGIPPTYAVDRGLEFHAEALEDDLVVVGTNPDGRPVHLTRAAAAAWKTLQAAARHDRIELIPVSGFRSVARQAGIIREKLNAGQQIPDILRVIAAPGFSEHHSGQAIDIGSPGYTDLEENFAGTAAFQWLESRAGDFGFTLSYPRGNPFGIGYEPWHWRFRSEVGQ